MSHEEASELLGAYALDAVDADEVIQVEEHLDTCPRCRAELDELREVAGALGNSVAEPPEALWSGIVSRLPERQEGEEPVPPMPRLSGQERFALPRADAGDATHGESRCSSPPWAAFAVAAAAVAVVLGIGLVQADHKVSHLQQAAGHQAGAAVAAALELPGHQVIDLESRHEPPAGRVRRGARRAGLPGLLAPAQALRRGTRTSCGGSSGTQPISLGLLGASPHQATFTMAGSVQPMQLSITAEPAGGSVTPTGSIVATGTV